VYLDDALVTRAQLLVPRRGLSQLLNDLLAERLDQMEREALEARMREGYIATREERAELNVNWEQLDGEGWPA
jgi:hypothetical protein